MMNALFVLIVFLLQLNKDLLHVKWPFGIKTNITYDDFTQEVNTAPLLSCTLVNVIFLSCYEKKYSIEYIRFGYPTTTKYDDFSGAFLLFN